MSASRKAAKRPRVAAGGAGDGDASMEGPVAADRPVMWTPSAELKRTCRMAGFSRFVSDRTGLAFADYDALWRWSVDNIEAFWEAVWEFCGVESSEPYTSVLEGPGGVEGNTWFPGARLNFAQNLLRFRDDSVAYTSLSDASRAPVTVTYAELYDEVARLQRALKAAGVKRGDRVGGVIPNIPQAGAAMLAAVSLGAVWSSCSPDFGLGGVMDRFGQIEPKVVFIADGYYFKGKLVDSVDKFKELPAKIPSLQRVVVVNFTTPAHMERDLSIMPKAVHYHDFLAPPAASGTEEIEFEQVPFDHPVYIMYSSGTTGLPKCIVQGAGVLLNHLKELKLHCDVGRGDRLFYFSTCGWMMWNWLTSGLALGANLILFDGNPLYPTPGTLFKMAQDLRITHFGCSAKYLHVVAKSGVSPRRDFDLSALRTIMSTGSPSTRNTFKFVYEHIKPTVQFASISGGTDLNGCFALGCPLLPVRMEELQCRGLGMKVAVYDSETGKPCVGKTGELVCEAPFPSQPLFFWGDDADGSKYHKAYFADIPGVWRHGDFAELSEHGGMVIYGRSDATLNPGGVRIGTSELYRVTTALPFVADAIVVGQPWNDDTRVVMFVKMAEGETLTEKHKAAIRKVVRAEVSPRHVPAKIVQCPDIPYTLSGKKVELAVRDLLQGRDVPQKDALSNPESLKFFTNVPELAED
uniref:Acetoacetate--CoA ligase n=1 Tax=Bicosoecida sp. CB-2014 TaxID=1486930 RepID=A0A7S1CML6_9STRA